MHIVDGALSTPVVVAGAVLAAAGVVRGLRDMSLEKVPATGVLAATFFVASLVNVPIGPSSVHLIMNGLAGLVLGWAAFPALFVGLLLQAIFFGFGGLMVLGVNTLNIALPAVIVGLLFRKGALSTNTKVAMLSGAAAGAGAILLTALMVAVVLLASGQEFLAAAKLVVVAHLPVMVVEGLICAAAVLLVGRVKPELFGAMGMAPLPGRAA
jgi:cobalt/nickel transport system permease protein